MCRSWRRAEDSNLDPEIRFILNHSHFPSFLGREDNTPGEKPEPLMSKKLVILEDDSLKSIRKYMRLFDFQAPKKGETYPISSRLPSFLWWDKVALIESVRLVSYARKKPSDVVGHMLLKLLNK